MFLDGDEDAALVARIGTARDALAREIERVVVGQRSVLDLLLTTLLADGHAILIGVPGLAKTLLASTLARVLDLSFQRIQFTPDLMPSDITGTDVLVEDREAGTRSFRFLKGPVFTQLLLADEINRTPPKTQAALLEAMQEKRVTAGEHTWDLPRPFLVLATQNPVEQEGTYRLPEAQLDRFLLAIRIGYPSEEDELAIMQLAPHPESLELPKILTAQELLRLQSLVPRVPAADHVCRYALRVVRSTRPESPESPAYVREQVSLGAGPRAAQALLRAAKARTLLEGRVSTQIEDVRAVAVAVLAHRLVTTFHANAQGTTAVSIVERLLDEVRSDAATPLD